MTDELNHQRQPRPKSPPPALRLGVAILVVAAWAHGATAADAGLTREFANTVKPFLQKYCVGCHGGEKPKGALDLSGYGSIEAVARDHRTWELVAQRLEAAEMPPETEKKQPADDERRAVLEWFAALREHEARRNAGDPGTVLARRLSNAEYDYTIRDLTGVDIRPTREFPVDPANEAGFDNSGESLAMSPALLKKYLAAARLVAEHLVLGPEGFVFAPHPAVTETDRDKYCVERIVAFYRRQRVDYADYFLAAWRHAHRAGSEEPAGSLHDIARAAGLSGKYLEKVHATLARGTEARGPLGEVCAEWRNLPADPNAVDKARRGCERLRDLIARLREELEPAVEKLHLEGISDGSQPFVLWKNRRQSELRMSYVPREPAKDAKADAPKSEAKDDAKSEPADERLAADLATFCRVFPDTFFVVDRGPYFDPKAAGQGRLLTAGFHLMQGYFRDDRPLYELVLDDAGRRELDALWFELDFITLVPMRQYKDYIFFERAEPPRFMQEAEFDFARSEDKDATSVAKMEQLAGMYLAKARRIGAHDEALEAIATYFKTMSAEIRRVEAARLAAEPSHLAALLKFAGRAYRRPMAQAERDDLLAFYRALRGKEGLGHEEALRDALASVLLSPHFCYRVDSIDAGAALTPGGASVVSDKEKGTVPLSDYALASRLSYFLWSSLPDDELLAHAAAGDLHTPRVLVEQTRRMLRDERVRGLAAEFGGHWLDFRRFEEHNSVDRERFAVFTNELRQAMYEEPLRFFIDLARRNAPVLEFFEADHTFVNPILAQHYGMQLSETGPGEWTRVEGASLFGRGGLLPMAVFLTQNAPGLRTSPVKRGYWVVRRLLGEHIPAPPPEVPELPEDEAGTGDLTLPQLLARHREHKSCAGCHDRFDAIGLAFEGYGPIGERRARDLGGRPVETRAKFPDGTEGSGLEGLRRYLRQRRQDEFIDNLCRKLFVYALGRGLMLSDKPALDEMRRRLAADEYRFGTLVATIVTSPQFLNRRGREDPRE